MKALFIPLKSKYFEAFERRIKSDELRLYGQRWNEKNCRIGRDVVLSKGYGTIARVSGRISNFQRIPASQCSEAEQIDILEVYGRLDVDIARISISLNG